MDRREAINAMMGSLGLSSWSDPVNMPEDLNGKPFYVMKLPESMKDISDEYGARIHLEWNYAWGDVDKAPTLFILPPGASIEPTHPTVLPGKYCWYERYEERVVCITFQTLGELNSYLNITNSGFLEGKKIINGK